MNLPNQLTVLRLVLAALFVAAREMAIPFGATFAALCFGLAVLTDYLDGHLARRGACESDFGRLMDPLADKVLVAAALVSLAASADIPAWAAIVLISRDFLVTGLRQLALSRGRVLAADPAGKTKTASQMVMISYFLLRDTAVEWIPVAPAAMRPWDLLGMLLIGASVILSIYSGIRYVRNHWDVVTGASRARIAPPAGKESVPRD